MDLTGSVTCNNIPFLKVKSIILIGRKNTVFNFNNKNIYNILHLSMLK